MDRNCRKANKLLNAYIDGELNSKDTLFFENHIKECSKCKEEFESYKLLIDDISQIEMAPLPSDFKEKLHLRLAEENVKSEKTRFPLRPYINVAVSAALVCVVLFGADLYKYNAKEDLVTINSGSLTNEVIEDESTDLAEDNKKQLKTANYATGAGATKESSLADTEVVNAPAEVSFDTADMAYSRMTVHYAEYSVDLSDEVLELVKEKFTIKDDNTLICSDDEFSVLMEIFNENMVVINYVADRNEDNLIRFE